LKMALLGDTTALCGSTPVRSGTGGITFHVLGGSGKIHTEVRLGRM
jgi:hypothetical protein